MKKMTSALLASVALTSAAFAGSNATGFYVGGSVGMANTQGKYNANNMTTDALNFKLEAKAQQYFANDAGKVNPLFGLFVGYGIQFGQGYVGAELFGGIDTAKVKLFDGTTPDPLSQYQVATLKRTAFYGFSVRGGFFVTPSTLLFARAGIEGGKFQFKTDLSRATKTAVGGNVTQADVTAASTPLTVSKNRINFVVGLGLDVFVTKNMFMRAEYNYLFGPSLNSDLNMKAVTNFAGTNLLSKVKISQDQFKLGFGFKF